MQDAFKRELAELLYTAVPNIIRENIDNLSHDEYDMLSENIDVHVLFSIRSDRLSSMHSLTDVLPNLLKNRFEIHSLSTEQARQAILKPAAIESEMFATHPFGYDEDALSSILSQFSTGRDNENITVEPFHLQIICQACEVRIEDKLKHGEVDQQINKSDLPSFDNLYGDYYKRQIEQLPEELREKAQQLLENNLIHTVPNTNEYRRIPVDKDVLISEITNIKAPPEILDMLEQAFLIRREQNSVGGYSYEIAHDTILDPIVNIKKQRQERENEKKIAQLLISKKRIERERIFGRITLAFLSLWLIAILAYFNWETIYFSYKIFFEKDERPVIRKPEKLILITSKLKEEVINSARQVNRTSDINTWEASQLLAALYHDPAFDQNNNIKIQYLNQAQKSMNKANCSWREMVDIDDVRATSWIVSTNGILGLTNRFSCSTLNFLLSHQDSNGAWPMFILPKHVRNYSATYATCHALRALHNSLPNIKDSLFARQIRASIQKGKQWLLQTIADKSHARWSDYEQKEGEYESLAVSKSLSGLSLHTLNILGNDIDTLNKNWLRSLEKADAAVDINLRERSDKNFKTDNTAVAYTDATRQLVIPWQIIATVSAYKDGDFSEKLKANKWIDIVIENLDADKIGKTDRFAKAEVLIALRYLLEEDYDFK
ncbi:hypothetical protein MKP09_05095 [Niabella ginsengisoli]|uniref:Squalene cyclase C-terminal domain-containing protein n=1 Tax=Niabella ginsengisoli TaxID=522298 RepID=A0ABS9SG33_9BACT|nr:hypothetical protein [Niabella ginsengisoli]MCH5597324.1 hypothetical protein [Niabella ginsengisoli]